MRKRKNNFPQKFIGILAIILLATAFIIGYIWKVLNTSDLFLIRQVIVRNSVESFDYLKNKNIFNVNLNRESKKAFLKCPDCRKVRFSRILPDCLVVDFFKRKPVALIRFSKDFAVDEQGVLFYSDAVMPPEALPVIYGLETKIAHPEQGAKYRRPELSLALSIISEFNVNKAFRIFVLKSVDVANPETAGFFMLLPKPALNYGLVNLPAERSGFEVRIGVGNIKGKLMILGGLVMQARKDWGNIKYIDLRFKEPLINLNNVK